MNPMTSLSANMGAFGIIATILAIAATVVAFVMIVPESKREKLGRFGKFLACPGFPECRNAHPLVKDTGGLCPLDGGHMLVRKSAKGRVYYGCSNYPKCNYMTWDEPVPEKCPQCGSTLFKKKGQLYCAKEGCGFVKAIEKK